MLNPELYKKCTDITKKDALDCLEKYSGKIQWRVDDSIMDLGCGDGTVTTDILKPFLSSNFKKLVGSDRSEIMITFANKNYGDERTEFKVLDMGGVMPDDLKNEFDHVFSFYAIHWVHNQESVFTNISQLLKEGGDCFLVFLGYTPIHEAWRVVSRNARWQPFIGNVENSVTPYQDNQEPEKQVKRTMLEVGFKNIDVKCVKKTYTYDMELFRNTMELISPFKVPLDLKEEFLDDFVKVVRDLGLLRSIDNEPVVTINYSLLVVYGSCLLAYLQPVYSHKGNYPQIVIDRVAAASAKEGLNSSRLRPFTEDQIQYIRGTGDFLTLIHYVYRNRGSDSNQIII